MKFRISAVAAGLSGLLAANGALAAQQWNMATAYPDPFFHTKNIHQFVKEIAEASKGDLKITVHSAQSLYKLPEIHRAVQSGQIQMGETIVSLLANEDRVYEVDSLLFFAESYDQAKRLWKVSKPFIASRLAKKGLMLLYSVPWPPQGFLREDGAQKRGRLQGPQVPRLQRHHLALCRRGRRGADDGAARRHPAGVLHGDRRRDDHLGHDGCSDQVMGLPHPLPRHPRPGWARTWSS